MRTAILPLLREVGDLKRITASGRSGSIAERAFRRAWRRLLDGASAASVALETTAGCLAATRLADLDAASLAALGVPAADASAILRAGVAEAAADLAGELRDGLVGACDALPSFDGGGAVPGFVDALAAQPRAGATCPGKPRIVLLPAENHAEHCLVVAVYAVLLAEPGTDRGTAFLAGLAHHLHNAAMPDAGFTGEMLLGDHLGPVMARATGAALAELPEGVRAQVVAARRILPEAETAEGRAFHAGDVVDRVLEMEQHVRRARVTLDDVLGDMALVHEGPLKPYHDRVLAEMGLA